MIPPLGPAARARRAAVRQREELVAARLQTLAPSLDGEPDSGFQARTRARLVAMAAVRDTAAEPAPARRIAPVTSAPARWRTRVTSALAGAALAVTAVAGVVAISSGVGPDDALYGVKRGTEAAELALASDDRRGETLLDFAGTRLAELGNLVRDGDPDPALVIETLTTMDQQTREGAAWQARLAVQGADDAPLQELAAWRVDQARGLLALGGDMPAAASDRYTGSLALLDEVGTRVAGLEGAVQCAAGPATAGADDLGPLPAACPPEVGAPGSSGGTGGTPVAPATSGGTGTTDGGNGGVSQADPGGSGSGGTGGTGGGAGGSADTGGTVPTGPDAPVESPELPTVQPTLPRLPTPSAPLPSLPLPSVGGLLPGQSSAPSSDGVLPCVPPLGQLTC